jgi:hypothetical protein
LIFILESGATGCEVFVSGKFRAARAKSIKFTVRLYRSYNVFKERLLTRTDRTAS